MSYTVAGMLKLPETGKPAAGVILKFVALQSISPVLDRSESTIVTSATGAYSIQLEYNTYSVFATLYDNKPVNCGQIVLNSTVATGLDLPTLLNGGLSEPLDPVLLVELQNLASAATSAAQSAASSAVQAAASAAEATLISGISTVDEAIEVRTVSLRANVRESLLRSYAEAGYNVVGTFQAGFTYVNANDVGIDETTGKGFTGPAGEVAAGTDPASGGFVDRSGELLRDFVNQELAKTNSQVETIAPSLPGVTNDNKFFMSWGEARVRGYIVSRTKNGFYSAVALTDEVSPADAQNTGGASNIRPGKVLKCLALKLAKTKVHSKTTGVSVPSLTPTQIRSVWGYAPTVLFRVVANAVADFDWNNPNVYSVPYSSSANESITYKVNAGRSATVIFGVSGGSSNNVLIETSFDGVTFAKYRDVDTSGGISGSVLRKEVDVVTGAPNPWYIRITNKTTAAGSFAYVAGLNIMDLPRDGLWDFDSVILQIVGGSTTDQSYQMVNGANEFAALESTTGKWFGTYHGGHSEFLERLRTDGGGSIDIRGALTSFAYMSSSFELYSQSKITSSGGVVCNYSAVTQFGDGCHITSYGVDPISQPNIRCVRVFTHMCTTSPNFERVILPEYVIKEDDGLVPIGNVQHCKQDRANDVASVRCWWSGVRSVNNVYGGGYVSFQPNYNKQYYGPIVDIPNYFSGGMFVTAKEYT